MENNSKNNQYDLCLVLACYNEAGHLEASVKSIEETLSKTDFSFELLFLNDTSPDNTLEVIKKVCEGKSNYRYVHHEKNVGRGGTVREGLEMSNAKYAGFIDVDLEVDAMYIPGAIKKLDEGYDAVFGHRYYDLFVGSGVTRAILSIGYRLVVKILLGIKTKDTEAGFKFFNMSTCRDVISKTKDNYWFWDTEIVYEITKSKKKIYELPCLFIRNNEIETTVRFFRDIYKYIVSIFAFRYKKLFKKS